MHEAMAFPALEFPSDHVPRVHQRFIAHDVPSAR
jgi:hypothetical protein